MPGCRDRRTCRLRGGSPGRSGRHALLPRRGLIELSTGATVLDVRQISAKEESHVEGALNIPLHELSHRQVEPPDGRIWVHCTTGYRASVAASMLDRAEREVVLVDDDFENAEKQGLTV